MLGVMAVMETSFKRAYTSTIVFSAPDPMSGHSRLTPPLEIPGHTQASLAQSLVESLLLSPGSLVHIRLCLCPPRVCFRSLVEIL